MTDFASQSDISELVLSSSLTAGERSAAHRLAAEKGLGHDNQEQDGSRSIRLWKVGIISLSPSIVVTGAFTVWFVRNDAILDRILQAFNMWSSCYPRFGQLRTWFASTDSFVSWPCCGAVWRTFRICALRVSRPASRCMHVYGRIVRGLRVKVGETLCLFVA